MSDPAVLTDLEFVVQQIIDFALIFAGVVCFIMLLIGGYKYLTSAGEPKAVQSARNTLTYALIGLLVIFFSFLLLRLISSFTGVDLLKFTISPS